MILMYGKFEPRWTPGFFSSISLGIPGPGSWQILPSLQASQLMWVQSLCLTFISCAALGQLLNFSETQFLHCCGEWYKRTASWTE